MRDYIFDKPMNAIQHRRRHKPRRKPVTLIVGIICWDGIVVASDSQTTWGTGKSWNTNKMNEIAHGSGRILVAESGATITSAKVIEHLHKICSQDSSVTQSLEDISGQAVRKVRDDLRTQQFNCSSEEFRDFIFAEELDCELMMAHYQNSPRIDTITLNVGIANRAKHYFEAVGSGADLATYLLNDLCEPEMSVTTAVVIAVYIIEIVKRHDPYCGGPTKLGILRAPPTGPPPLVEPFKGFEKDRSGSILWTPQEIQEITRVVSQVEAETKRSRSETIKKALEERTATKFKSFWDKIGFYEPPPPDL